MSHFSNNYYCSCDNCYCSDFEPQRFFPCAKGTRKRIEKEKLIKKEEEKEKRLKLIKKEEEDFIKRKKLEIKIREEKKEKDRKKKIFYDFWYYTLLFILSYEFLKKLIMYNLSTIY